MPETTPSDFSITAWRFGDCELRLPDCQLVVAGEPRPKGGRAFDVLVALVEASGEVVGKDELLAGAWRGSEVEESNLASQISHLRRLVGRGTIATVSGRGYRLATVARQLQRQLTPEPGATPLSSAPSAPGDCLQFEDLEWSPAERAVRVDGRRAALRSRSIDLLDVLIAERQSLVSKQELLDRACGAGVGKTRVARASARRHFTRFAHGAWWFDLDVLSSPAPLLPAIAASARVQLGQREQVFRQLAWRGLPCRT